MAGYPIMLSTRHHVWSIRFGRLTSQFADEYNTPQQVAEFTAEAGVDESLVFQIKYYRVGIL